jgi:hypothetical protein
MKEFWREKERQDTEQALEVRLEDMEHLEIPLAFQAFACSDKEAQESEKPGWMIHLANRLDIKWTSINPAFTKTATVPTYIPSDILRQWAIPIWQTSWLDDQYNVTTNPQTQQRTLTRPLLNLSLVCSSWQKVIFGANTAWRMAMECRFPYLDVLPAHESEYEFLKRRIEIVQKNYKTPVDWNSEKNDCCPELWSELIHEGSQKFQAIGKCPTCGNIARLYLEYDEFREGWKSGNSAAFLTRKPYEIAMWLHHFHGKDLFKEKDVWLSKEFYDESGPIVHHRPCF